LDSPLGLVQNGSVEPLLPTSLTRTLSSLSRDLTLALATRVAMASPPWLSPCSGHFRAPLTTPLIRSEPLCDDLSICPRGSVLLFHLWQIASSLDLVVNRLRRLAISDELASSPSMCARVWDWPGAGAVLATPVPSSLGAVLLVLFVGVTPASSLALQLLWPRGHCLAMP
jgi:hypothetical protein